MKWLRRRITAAQDNFDSRYDAVFGDPSTDVFTTAEFLQFLDDVIQFDCIEATDDSASAVDEFANHKISKIVATEAFESALKQLKKKRQTDTILELKRIVIELLDQKVSTQHANHPLTNLLHHRDIHLAGGRLILIYKYLSDDELVLSLKLQDVVEHKELKHYNKSALKRPTHTFDTRKFKSGEET